MSSSLAVVLDANVLIPMALCDTLLRAANERLYRPHWSEETLDEVRRNLIKKKMASAQKVERRIRIMQEAFWESTVSDYESLIPVMSNDPKDRHVLAAAVRMGAQVIVTRNIKHFPRKALKCYDIEPQTPDDFLLHLLDLNPETMIALIQRQATALKNPPSSFPQLIVKLRDVVPEFARTMENAVQGRPPITEKQPTNSSKAAAHKIHAN